MQIICEKSLTLADILMTDMHLECNTPACTPAASEGSVIRSSGTYGCTISLKDDTRIVYGFPMTSYRAEAYRIWSILLFIIRLFEFHDHNPSNTKAVYRNDHPSGRYVHPIMIYPTLLHPSREAMKKGGLGFGVGADKNTRLRRIVGSFKKFQK